VLGVGIFLLLMMTAVQVLTHLYATSVVEATAYDAVQAASSASGGGVAAAEARARDLMGGLSDGATFDWTVEGDEVAVRIVAERNRVLPGVLGERLGLHVVDREFRMRVEEFR
jgi:hypothetical protein